MTEVKFRLKPGHQLILRVLYEVKGELHFKELERVIGAVNAVEPNFGDFIRIVTDKKPLSMDKLLGKAPPAKLERDIEGLQFLGLIETRIHYDSGSLHIPSGLGNISLRDCDVISTEEGKRVGKGIVEERRVIIRPRPPLRTSIFVACAFGDEEIDQLYEEQLVPACEELGYDAFRVDLNEPEQTITELMLKAITEAAVVLADLTHARPSVYFEVGYAHGLGVPIVLTCREDHERGESDNARVYFDLEQYKISYWSRTSKNRFRWGKGVKPGKRLASIIPPRTK